MIDFYEQAMIFLNSTDQSQAKLTDLLERVWIHGHAQGMKDERLCQIADEGRELGLHD